jgi:addiction module HigA family antidote
MIPKNRPPTSPGEILSEEFLMPLSMTQTALAERMGVPVQAVNLLVNGRRAVTAETAIKLSKVFDTSPQFWMNLQTNLDLWSAQKDIDRERITHSRKEHAKAAR